jgi:hypothetical protein
MCVNTSTPSATECKRFDRKAVMPLKERIFAEIVKDIEAFPLDTLGDLITNSVGSDAHLTAVKDAIDYSKKTGSRYVLSLADGEAVLDTSKPVESHAAAFRKLIHDNMFLRAVTWKANDSECPEYFTEQKKSNTTGKKELYVAIRVGEENEQVIAHIRGSRQSSIF